MDNLELWNKVCESNPSHTKKVTFGRGFTAIDPMHQVKNATEQFGQVGVGWGWKVERVDYLPNDTVAVLVRLWVKSRDNYFEQWGQCGLYTDGKKTKDDNDCMKKATTDGITKCLPYLGFNADIFLGKFDDNKYVREMEDKYEPKPVGNEGIQRTSNKLINKAFDAQLKEIGECESIDVLKRVYQLAYKHASESGCSVDQLAMMEQQKDARKTFLEGNA